MSECLKRNFERLSKSQETCCSRPLKNMPEFGCLEAKQKEIGGASRLFYHLFYSKDWFRLYFTEDDDPKLNCTTAVSPALRLCIPALFPFINVFFPPPSTRFRLSVSPFLSSSSCFHPPFSSSTSMSWILPSFLPFSLIHSVHLPIQSLTHYIAVQSAALSLSIVHANSVLHWNLKYFVNVSDDQQSWHAKYCAFGKLLNRWVFLFPKVKRTPCFWFVMCVCELLLGVAVCLCASRVHLHPEVGCHVLSDTTYMSVLAWLSINLCPASFLLQSTAVQVRGPGGRKKETSVDTHDQ